jgi:hypothetical protein
MNLGEAAWLTGFPPSRTHHLAFFLLHFAGLGFQAGLCLAKVVRNAKNNITAINAVTPPKMKVATGETCSQRKPAAKLAGNATSPVIVWYVPKAVALKSAPAKSDTNALSVPSTAANTTP